MTMVKQSIMLRNGQFIAKPTRMGKKVVVIVPLEFHDEILKVLGRTLKFDWSEIIEAESKGKK